MSRYRFVPDVGTLFEYKSGKYRLTSWLKERTSPISGDWLESVIYDAQQRVGPDHKKLVFCRREEATYVSGVGVTGCIAPIEEIRVTGNILDHGWTREMVDDERRCALALVGQIVF